MRSALPSVWTHGRRASILRNLAVAARDTLSLMRRLKAAGFAEDQAEALSGIMLDASRADAAHLATTADLSEAKAEIVGWVIGAIGLQTLALLGAVVALVRLGFRT